MGVAVVVAIGVGIAVASQVAIVGRASRSIHPLTVSLALQASGVLIAIGWAVWSRTWPQITEVAREWWWIPLGVLGWGIVAALGFSAARMGASSTLAIVIASQLIAALLLDRLVGRIEISFQAAAGALVLIFGVLLVTSSARSTL